MVPEPRRQGVTLQCLLVCDDDDDDDGGDGGDDDGGSGGDGGGGGVVGDDRNGTKSVYKQKDKHSLDLDS